MCCDVHYYLFAMLIKLSFLHSKTAATGPPPIERAVKKVCFFGYDVSGGSKIRGGKGEHLGGARNLRAPGRVARLKCAQPLSTWEVRAPKKTLSVHTYTL